jgi:hypothetical protein
MNTKRGVLFKAVFVRAILFSQFLQLGRIRGMSHQQLNNGFSNSIYLFRSGSDDYIFFHRVNAGNDELCPAFYFHFDDADPATPEGFQLLMMTERGYGNPGTSGGLKQGHSFIRFNLFSVNI